MRTQTKLLSLVITLLVLTILASPVSALDPDVPDNSTFDYFIEYGPYSTDDYGPYEAGWHGPVYNASLQYPLTDYEIDIDIDFSGNNDYTHKMGVVLITGYSGDNQIWIVGVGDTESSARRLHISCLVGDRQLANALAPVAADWSGRLKFVHSTPDNWELWVGGNLLNNLTKPDIGSLTNITVDLLRYGTNSRIIPGMSCDRIAIYGVVDETLLPQPVEFRPYYTSQYGNVPLNGVQITVYTCDPVTLEPGDVVDIFTVDYGDIRSLPRGYYCIEASLINYEQVYSISETRFSNVDGPAVALIPMEREDEPNQPVVVGFQPFDINGNVPLNGVQITVYTCDPVTLEPGDVVDIFTVDYGDIRSLPRGYYCIEASLINYEQVYSISETRFSNVDGPAVALIPMEREDEPNQPVVVGFQPFDINGNVPLNGVQITVYTCDPVTLEPGDVVDIFTVDYGDIRSLPRGYYCIEASLINYEQVYSISETRFSNVDGPAVALIPMEYVGGEDGSVEVRIVDVDTEEPLQKVRLRIYEALPNFQQGRLVRDVTVNSGDYISLPAGRYFAQASKSGYSQYFEVTNTRVVVDPPSPSILYIPMTSRDVVTPGEGSFLDQSIEAIANLFGVSFEIGKIILGMLLALGVGTATAKQLRGGAQEFGLGMLGGVVLGVLIGLLPIWVLVLLVLIVGLWVGHRYMSGGDS